MHKLHYALEMIDKLVRDSEESYKLISDIVDEPTWEAYHAGLVKARNLLINEITLGD